MARDSSGAGDAEAEGEAVEPDQGGTEDVKAETPATGPTAEQETDVTGQRANEDVKEAKTGAKTGAKAVYGGYLTLRKRRQGYKKLYQTLRKNRKN